MIVSSVLVSRYTTDELVGMGLMVLACPFCGSWSVTAVAGYSSQVVCDGCGAVGPVGPSLKDAVAQWNGRLTEAVRIAPLGNIYEATHRAVHCGNGTSESAT